MLIESEAECGILRALLLHKLTQKLLKFQTERDIIFLFDDESMQLNKGH